VFSAHTPPPCPSGDGGTLRYLFVRHGGSGEHGGFWIWCHICRSYEHASVAVPEWWQEVAVQGDQLAHDPGWLDENRNDGWLEQQPPPR
jgi:hypothetical protein